MSVMCANQRGAFRQPIGTLQRACQQTQSLFGETCCSLIRGEFIREAHQTFIYLMYWSLNRVEKNK